MERTLRVLRARTERVGERLLQRGGLLAQIGGLVGVDVARPVEHRGAYRGGEARHPRRPERTSVRRAEIGDLVLTEGASDLVHVVGAVVGRHIREETTGSGLALLAQRLRCRHQGLMFGRCVGCRVEGEEGIEIVGADDRARPPGAARIPPDDVEPVGERRREITGRLLRHVAARNARASRVHQQRTDPLTGPACWPPFDVEVDETLGRVVIVLRHGKRGALQLLATASPLERTGSGRRRRRWRARLGGAQRNITRRRCRPRIRRRYPRGDHHSRAGGRAAGGEHGEPTGQEERTPHPGDGMPVPSATGSGRTHRRPRARRQPVRPVTPLACTPCAWAPTG